MGQLHLILEIRHRPQAADQDIGLLRAREIGHQITEADNLHVHQVGRRLLCQRNALIKAEHRLFTRAGGDSQHHFIEHTCRAGDNIDMTVGDGVEGTRIDRFCAHDDSFSE